ncbi:hypothetical protein FQN57_006048 [Myotisia sp. PD_48]|nr:hypothetical protein FQN57_006048 [Myotisia sp. PD_48]
MASRKNKMIDLESDTKSLPTAAMKQYMMDAPLGDEQYDEDTTTLELCKRVSTLLGKEAGIFLPSGTMCNEIAIGIHCQPGDEIICHRTAHIVEFEAAGLSAISGAMVRLLDGDDGMFTADQVREAIRPKWRYAPNSRLLCIEQTANLGGGVVWPLNTLQEVTDVAREAGLATHMDGARLFNAVVASGVPAAEYAGLVDSVWIDLTKGLGAPIGAVLCGSADFIEKAWRLKQRFGGAMRQSGIVAAAGIYALEHNIDRLADDHRNAQLLAEGLATIPGVIMKSTNVHTNMVFIRVQDKDGKPAAAQFEKTLRDHGVKASAIDEETVRFVTCLNVNVEDIGTAILAVTKTMTSILGA